MIRNAGMARSGQLGIGCVSVLSRAIRNGEVVMGCIHLSACRSDPHGAPAGGYVGAVVVVVVMVMGFIQTSSNRFDPPVMLC